MRKNARVNGTHTTHRLVVAVLLSALACVAVLVGGPAAFRLVAVGSFVVATPGLIVVTMLRIRDPLLSLVIGMVAGPAGWVMLSTALTYVGAWWPGPTVAVVAVVLAVCALVLLVHDQRTRATALDDARHRFAAHLHDEVVIRAVGRHRGAFPLR